MSVFAPRSMFAKCGSRHGEYRRARGTLDLTFQSITKGDLGNRKDLHANAVHSGRATSFDGIGERTTNESTYPAASLPPSNVVFVDAVIFPSSDVDADVSRYL